MSQYSESVLYPNIKDINYRIQGSGTAHVPPLGERMSREAKGSRNERRSRRLLEAPGYRVTRAAASLGCFNLVGKVVGDGIFETSLLCLNSS